MFSILMVQDIMHTSDIMRERHVINGQNETHLWHSENKALNMTSTSIWSLLRFRRIMLEAFYPIFFPERQYASKAGKPSYLFASIVTISRMVFLWPYITKEHEIYRFHSLLFSHPTDTYTIILIKISSL